MSIYKIICSLEKEIEAENEDEAMSILFEDLTLSNESLENFLEIEKIG